jgi:hypothetical protein
MKVYWLCHVGNKAASVITDALDFYDKKKINFMMPWLIHPFEIKLKKAGKPNNHVPV